MGTPHERLDAAMNERRLDLRMKWRKVADGAGVSYEALRAIRKGEYHPSELTRRGIDDTLRWKPGSVADVLAGGDPSPMDGDDEDALVQLVTELVRQGRPQSDLRKAVEHKDPDARERILIRVIAEGGTPTAGNF